MTYYALARGLGRIDLRENGATEKVHLKTPKAQTARFAISPIAASLLGHLPVSRPFR